jgi:hypothetical protein
MIRDDEFIGRLESYLDDFEGYTPMPAGLRDAVRASLPSVRQGGPLRGPESLRNLTVDIPTPARYGLVAAAVLAAAVIGASIFTGGGGIGGPSDPSAEPTPSPTVGPTSLLDSPDAGDLAPGDWYLDLDAYPARIDFEVPEGWWHYWTGGTRETSDVHALLVNSLDTTGAADGSAWGLGFTLVDEVYVDPCDLAAGTMDASVVESADSLATAFSSWPALPASVEDVSIGGYTGKRVELDPAALPCMARLFSTPARYHFEIQRAREGLPAPPEQFTFLDVEGSVLAIWTTDYPMTTYYELDGGATFDPQAHADDQVELQAILDSIVIQPRGAASR